VVELAATRRPAVILPDTVMRGLDGYTLGHAPSRGPADGNNSDHLYHRPGGPISRTLGAVAHVQKPFTLTTFRAAIGQALAT
jgi:CheY-like chemotaxis protein